MAIALATCLTAGCALPVSSAHGIAPALADQDGSHTPQPFKRPDIQLQGGFDTPRSSKGPLHMMKRVILGGVAPVTVAFNALISAPLQAVQLELQTQDSPIVRRRAPGGLRHDALAFARTELYFGTAKPGDAVTEEAFKVFLDDVITPLFPDGLTVIKGDGQFKGAHGLTIKEDCFVVILLYPVDGQKTSSKNIDYIRGEYMRQHRQESVLRLDDPFLVWVSF